ncbi:hypothetical protein ROZALSC1DRAFT_24279 [Rozella allomycis CSF55]|uniref:PB1 domain-containing protein n=1 Tax=Rozella allomycis (strain CSF55) TaxID=988480 RepID=A0A4P9YDY2_ROZAC|nr:hypothetical protein ROZALSC1DRAFT_24279 [Rozella allomycis CSF55]
MFSDIEKFATPLISLVITMQGGDCMVTIKARFGSTFRRVSLCNKDLTYNELCFIMQRLFKRDLSDNPENYQLNYIDEDDNDVQHALLTMNKLNIIVKDSSKSDLQDQQSINTLIPSLEKIRFLADYFIRELSNIQSLSGQEEKESPKNLGNTIHPLSSEDIKKFIPEIEQTEVIDKNFTAAESAPSKDMPLENQTTLNLPIQPYTAQPPPSQLQNQHIPYQQYIPSNQGFVSNPAIGNIHPNSMQFPNMAINANSSMANPSMGYQYAPPIPRKPKSNIQPSQ